MSGLGLSDAELTALFNAIDVNKDKNLTIHEMRSELRGINAVQVLTQLKQVIGFNNEKKFNETFDAYDGNQNGMIDVLEFAELINLSVKSTDKEEIDILFKMVDQ